jgi:hypothetical protein
MEEKDNFYGKGTVLYCNRGGKMRDKFVKRTRLALLMTALVMVCTVGTARAIAQEKKLPQTAGVDDTKMGPYRALAQLAYAAAQKGDVATAAKLARVLERSWDKAEDYGGDMALSKTNHEAFEQIDKAMDAFITLMEKNSTDAGAIKSAYSAYLDKLKLAD